jgi:hypothetical protein
MPYYTIVVPINGLCYIEECDRYVKTKYQGFQEGIGILPINQSGDTRLVAFAYNNNGKYLSSSVMLNYNFYKNRTCYINIYCYDNSKKKVFNGLDLYVANGLLKKLNGGSST